MENRPNTTEIVKRVLAILIIVFVFYFGIWPFATGGKRMKSFCRQITPGLMSSEVLTLAEKTSYEVREYGDGDNQTILIIDARAMGRYICDVDLDQGTVREARFVYND